MASNSFVRLTAAIATLSLAAACRAQDATADFQAFSSADRNLSFQYAAGWKVAEDAGRVHLTASDGSKYTLSRDSLSPAPAGNAANNPALQLAVSKLVHPLLTNSGYAGVKLLTVDSGTGAIYRFRGRGSKSDYDLAEVWVAIIGSHNVVLLSDTAPVPDHYYELSTLFRSLAFSDTPKPAGAGGGPKKPAGAPTAPPGTGTASAPPGSGLGASQAAIQRGRAAATTTVEPSAELERYDGHLIPGDTGFTLRVNHGSTATASWTRTTTPAKYLGTYTGEDGNYAVTLTKAADGPLGMPDSIKLTLHSSGGMVAGTYTSSTTPVQRQIAELKLTEVDAGKMRLQASNATNAANKMNRGRNGRGHHFP